jgi:hypothetical protein
VTQVHRFEAFKNGHLARGLKIVSTASGDCWGGALAVRRADAWRCHTASQIYDPCFSKPTGTTKLVVCPTSFPWVRRAVGIELSSSLPYRFGNPHRAPTSGRPWVIQTVNGKACTMLTGVSKYIRGKRIDYACTGGGGLVGDVRKKAKLWTIRFLPRASKKPAWTGVKTAWW